MHALRSRVIRVNAKSLAKIDSALFALCLDDESPSGPIEINSVMLHGDARNRWFDKSFQLVVCKNGVAAKTLSTLGATVSLSSAHSTRRSRIVATPVRPPAERFCR